MYNSSSSSSTDDDDERKKDEEKEEEKKVNKTQRERHGNISTITRLGAGTQQIFLNSPFTFETMSRRRRWRPWRRAKAMEIRKEWKMML